jgi:hypothetical protein
MFFALAVLLIHPQVNLQNAAQISAQMDFSEEKIALIQPTDLAPVSSTNNEASLPSKPDPADATIPPDLLPSAPEPEASVNAPAPIAFIKPSKSMTVSVDELKAERRHDMRLWMGLGIASHSAATFDAWSTRHAISTTGAQELDPLLRPFSGNASLYFAIQAGPALMDYVGKKMMDSRHRWVRRMWWVPQGASLASSLFCGSHNLLVQ